jgi:hypothetical protein
MTGDTMAEDALCTHQPGTFAAVAPPTLEYGAPSVVVAAAAPAAAADSDVVQWDPDARVRMKDIPAFVRGMVTRRVEAYCRDKGIARITPEILAEIRAKMPTPKLFGAGR